MNNFRFTIRIFLKDKFFSVLNILGLALGIAVSIVLMMILKNDLSYDKHYANHERIYRLGAHWVAPGVEGHMGVTARELAPLLLQTYPEIEELARVEKLRRVLVSNSKDTFYEEQVSRADSTYFKIFSHRFISGDVNSCLNDPKGVVITRAIATKYFSTEEAIGKTLTIDKELRTVTAVIEDLPETTHLKFNIMMSVVPEVRSAESVVNGKPLAWVYWNPDVYTFLLLPDKYDVNNFYSRFKSIYDTYFIGEGVGGPGTENTPILEPLADVHFSITDDYVQEYKALIAFTAIGILVVILACINYMNLSTAKAIRRATEITMKRLSGSGKSQLVSSLLFESILLSMVSLVVAIAMVYTFISPLNVLINRNLSIDFATIGGSFLISIVIGILSGIYPAFYLTNIPVIQTLKGTFKNSSGALALRRSLITIQFVISIFVVICTILMSNQLQFIRTRSLGFDKDNLLIIPTYKNIKQQRAAIQNEIRKLPGVVTTAMAGQVVGTGVSMEYMDVEGPNGMEQKPFLALYIDDSYLELIGIDLVQGRLFEKGEDVETEGLYLATEMVGKVMNWGDNTIGKELAFFGDQNHGKIIGVVEDFNVNALYSGVDPMVMIKGHFNSGFLHVKMTGENISPTIDAIKGIMSKFDNEHPFEYFFLDQKYDEQYKADVNRSRLLSMLSYTCVFISLLGLLGLTAFSAVQRTKEIGIRKVLGANIASILLLLSKDILLLVFLASAIAMPLGWYVIDGWLEGFAYRATFSYWLFVSTTFAAVMFVVFVTAFQSWRTATSNPVDSLKYE